MFCKSCGNKIADDATFCSNCGKKIEAEQSERSEPLPEPQGALLTDCKVVSVKSYLWVSCFMIPTGIFLLILTTQMSGVALGMWIILTLLIFTLGLFPLFLKAYVIRCPYCGNETLLPIKALSADCSVCNKKIMLKNGRIEKMSE